MEKNRIITRLSYSLIAETVIIAVLLFLLLGISLWASTLKEIIRCSGFQTQAEAQARFDSSTTKYASLDRNKDGIACNDLPKN